MIVYLDSSALLRVLFGESESLSEWATWERAYSSEITRLEVRRTVDRMRLEAELDDVRIAAFHRDVARLEEAIDWILLDHTILDRAGLPMRTAVKTLDAIHLASALLLRERRPSPLVFATHDRKQAIAAVALGFETIGA